MTCIAALTLGCRAAEFETRTAEIQFSFVAPTVSEFVFDTDPIELSFFLTEDALVQRVTLDLEARYAEGPAPVSISLALADDQDLDRFHPIGAFDLSPLETRRMTFDQAREDDPLVRGARSDRVRLRFEVRSELRPIDRIDLTFRIRARIRQDTSGLGGGAPLLF